MGRQLILLCILDFQIPGLQCTCFILIFVSCIDTKKQICMMNCPHLWKVFKDLWWLCLDNSKSAEDKFWWTRELWMLQKSYDGAPLQKDWAIGKLIWKFKLQIDTLYYLTYGAVVAVPCRIQWCFLMKKC